jgi:hypothetical protein
MGRLGKSSYMRLAYINAAHFLEMNKDEIMHLAALIFE